MSKLKVFAVRDQKAESFVQQPFFCLQTGQAVRGFIDAVNDKQTEIYAHPSDYELFEIGEFDQETGFLIPREKGVQPLGNGSSFKESV